MSNNAAPAPSRGAFQVVSFRLGTEEYGLAISSVREINRFIPVTNVPESAPFIEGVIDLRGQLVTIVDLRARFGMPKRERDRDSRIVIVDVGQRCVGLVVDAVCEVIRITSDDVAEVPELAGGADAIFIDNVVKYDNRLIVMLKLSNILSLKDPHAQHQLAAA